MTGRVFYLASGNAAKVELIAGVLGDGWTVEPISPGDAEERSAATDYRPAATAKAEAARAAAAAPFAVAHDSGFEFEELGWEPGPFTARWLRARGGVLPKLKPGGRVRVVHCLAVATATDTVCFLDADERHVARVPAGPAPLGLPLSHIADGPVQALSRVAGRAVRHLTRLEPMR